MSNELKYITAWPIAKECFIVIVLVACRTNASGSHKTSVQQAQAQQLSVLASYLLSSPVIIITSSECATACQHK